MMRSILPIFTIFILFAFTGSWSAADNWSQWRGSKWDNVSTETEVPDAINASNQQWKLPLPGPGGASPIVWGKQVFVTTTQGDGDGAAMFLMCVGTDGKLQWKKQLDGKNQNSRDSSNSASPSPSTDGKHVWVMMGNGILHCFTVGGELVWKKDLQAAYGKFNIQFGMTSSPILDNGVIYLALMHGDMRSKTKTSVGHIIALDAATGNENWYHKRLTDGVAENTHSYASPSIYRDKDQEFLIVHGGDYVTGHSLADGSEIWRCGGFNPHGDSYNPYLRLVASPTPVEGMIVVPTAKRGPVLSIDPQAIAEAIGIDKTGDSLNITEGESAHHWRLDRGTPDVASPLVYNGIVYLGDEKGVLVALDAETGKILYQERLFASNHRSTPVAADGKIYITGRDGNVFVVAAGPKFKLLSKFDLGEEITASPAISSGVVYIRTFDALYAFK